MRTRYISRKTFPILVMAGLAGCASAPAVKPSIPRLPTQWESADNADATRFASEVDWRDFFTDPQLQTLITRALANNADLRMAVARRLESAALYGVSEADRQPTTQLLNQYSFATYPTTLTNGSSITTKRYDLSLSVLPFEFDFWGRVEQLSNAAKARLVASEVGARLVRLSVITDTANAYFSLLELDERLFIARETVRMRETSLQLVEQAFEQGAVSKVEILQAQSALEAARSELDGTERQRASTANLLANLTGYEDGGLPSGRSLRNQSIDAAFRTGLPSQTLLQRPDVMAAEQRLIEARANVESARAAFFPKILLAAGIGMTSSALSSLLTSSAKNLARTLQPSISLPLFDGGRTEANAEAAAARENIALIDYERTVQNAFREVADLLAAQRGFASQSRAASAEFAIQDQRAEATEARYRAGAASYMEVLDATRQRLSAQQALLQMRRTELSIAVQLYKALGGGTALAGAKATLGSNPVPSHSG